MRFFYRLSCLIAGMVALILPGYTQTPVPLAIDAPKMTPWVLPEKALFFLPNYQSTWATTPPDAHEWILLEGVGFSLFDALSPRDTWMAKQRGSYEACMTPATVKVRRDEVLKDLSRFLSPEWKPNSELISIGTLHRKEGDFDVTHTEFQREGCNVLIIGTLGRGYYLYIEQLDPLPAAARIVTASEIKHNAFVDDITVAEEKAFTKAAIEKQVFMRYRAFSPNGPYERVRILLIQVDFPATLDIRSFGY